MFAISFAFISVAVGIFGTYDDVLRTSGPVGIWLWVIVAIGQTLVAIGLAVGTTQVNNRLVDALSLQNALGFGPVPVRISEYVAELYYTVAPVPGLLIRPNLQYVYSPGALSQNTSVFVLGLKTVISF